MSDSEEQNWQARHGWTLFVLRTQVACELYDDLK